MLSLAGKKLLTLNEEVIKDPENINHLDLS